MSERFFVEEKGGSWAVRDSEILIRYGPQRGFPFLVQWCSDQAQAKAKAAELNAARGHAADEPKCCVCGAQPAGGDEKYPRCGLCWSKISD